MGRHQRAETSGLISFLICAVVGAVSMNLYMEYAPAIWQLTQRRFMVCSGIVAACGVISFIIGYARKSRSLNLKHGWFAPIRRIFEIVALSVVYASTIAADALCALGEGEVEEERIAACVERVVSEKLGEMIVTPREVDALVERMAGVLADGINQALHPRLNRDEIAQMMAQ